MHRIYTSDRDTSSTISRTKYRVRACADITRKRGHLTTMTNNKLTNKRCQRLIIVFLCIYYIYWELQLVMNNVTDRCKFLLTQFICVKSDNLLVKKSYQRQMLIFK